jgi:predicted P-loop ATPase
MDTLCVKDTQINRGMTIAWCVGAVKRVFEPGCQNDQMLVLLGKEGIGKSSLIRLLGMGHTIEFDKSLSGDKDSLMGLHKGWLICVDEMAGMRRTSDREAMKTFITQTFSDYRPPYGRSVVHVPRMQAFVATTNNDEFLPDEPGNRRFWPLRCGGRKNDAHRLAVATPKWVEQVWAEAVAMYRKGYRNYLTGDDAAAQMSAVEEVLLTDDYSEQIPYYLDQHRNKGRVCVSCISREVFGQIRATSYDRRRIRAVLDRLPEWHRAKGRCLCGYNSTVWKKEK